MTTKEVIRTTVTIAKRWQYLWTQLPNLEICYGGVYSLIRHAINRNVQEVDSFICAYTSEVFSYDDELFFNNSYFRSMNIAHCAFIPPNGAIHWDNVKCLCIENGKLVKDSIGKILFGSPCLETLELRQCYGVGQIDATSKRFKKLVLTNYDLHYLFHNGGDYINTIEINAPYMLSLTINEELYLEKLLLLNVSSLAKADSRYQVCWHFANKLGRTLDDIEKIYLVVFYQAFSMSTRLYLGAVIAISNSGLP
ncbi:ribonuclease H-like domain-containing protein [Tanacetum coccineum]